MEKGCGSSKLYSSSLFSSYLRSSTEPDPDSQSCTVNPHTFTHILSIIGQASTSPLQIHASTFNTIPPPQDPTSVLFRYDPVSCFLPLSLSTPKPRLPSPCKKKKKNLKKVSKSWPQVPASDTDPELRHTPELTPAPLRNSELSQTGLQTTLLSPSPFLIQVRKGRFPPPSPKERDSPFLAGSTPRAEEEQLLL